MNKLQKQISGLEKIVKELKNIESSTTDLYPNQPENIMKLVSGYLGLSSKMEDDAVIRSLLFCAQNVVNAEEAGLTLYNREKNILRFIAETGTGSNYTGYEFPLENTVHGLAFVTGEVQSSQTIRHKEIEDYTNKKYRNVLVAPLYYLGEGIGTMSAVDKIGADMFDDNDMKAFKSFSDLAAIIISRKIQEEQLKEMLNGNKPATDQQFAVSQESAKMLTLINDISIAAAEDSALLDFLSLLVNRGRTENK